jgi:hypothetical protein
MNFSEFFLKSCGNNIFHSIRRWKFALYILHISLTCNIGYNTTAHCSWLICTTECVYSFFAFCPYNLFWRVRKCTLKNAHASFICFSTCMNSRTTESIFMKLDTGRLTNICWHILILVKIWQQRAHYVSWSKWWPTGFSGRRPLLTVKLFNFLLVITSTFDFSSRMIY